MEHEFADFDVNMVTSNKLTLLHTACQVNSKAIAKLLITSGCLINSQDKNGNTCLHSCFLAGADVLGYYLIDKINCDDAILNKDGLDCYQVSVKELDELDEKRPDMYLGDGALGANIDLHYEE